MEIAGEDGFRIRSYRNGATAMEGYPGAHRRYPARPRRARSPTSPASAKGWRTVLAEIVERGSCERRDLLLAEIPARRARVPQDPGPRPKEHRADLRALPHQHHRRTGAPLPGAEAARAAAHGRQAGREGAALHRAVSPAHRPLSAELRRRRRGRTDRGPARRCRASRRSRPPAACGAGARRWAISTCW